MLSNVPKKYNQNLTLIQSRVPAAFEHVFLSDEKEADISAKIENIF